jgi:transcriptional regulator with XRE-family HTH domain
VSTKSDSLLRNIRRARTLSQSELAQLVGVSQKTISAAECGRLHLKPTTQTRIATILGVSREDLFPSVEVPS